MWELPVLLVVGIGFGLLLAFTPRPNYARDETRRDKKSCEKFERGCAALRLRSGSGTVR